MIRKSIFDTPSTPRLYTFLQWVRDGQLFIPDFQRPFEWDDQRRLDLLDSVSRGLPIGAFMVWRTLREDLATYPSLGPFDLPEPKPGEARSFLIDGHQRVTTLFAALQPLEPGGLEELQQAQQRWPVFFDLEAGTREPGFKLASRRRGFQPPRTWLPTNELFDPKALWRRQRELAAAGLEPLAERTEELANAFKDYIVPVLPLVTDDMGAVTDTFVRVNSGGKTMSEDKILRALVYADHRIDEHIDELRSWLAALGWGELKEQVFVNALKVRLQLDVYRSTPVDVKRAVEARGGFGTVMDELRTGMIHAATLLVQCGIPGPGVLPYQYQLIGLSEALLRAIGYERLQRGEWDADEKALVRERVFYWLWATTYAAYFTGMTGNRIRDAIEHLHDVMTDARTPLPDDLERRVEAIDSFRGNSTRTLAMVLRIADEIPDTELRTKALARLGESGIKAVDRIFPGVGDTILGNRVVTIPGQLQALREALERDPSTVDDGLARAHFIPPNALEVLAANPRDPSLFLELRGWHLREIEAYRIRALGLEPEFPDD